LNISVNQRIKIAVVLAAVIFTVLYFFFPKDEEKPIGAIRVGAGKDITGVLLESIVAEAEQENNQDAILMAYIFVDCCSNTAQWALQAEEIDLGFYCSSAAISMMNKVDGFELYAPIIMNSEVIAALPETEEIETVGIPRKRTFLGDLITKSFAQVSTIREIDRTYIGYSVKLGEVDGAVLDVMDAATTAADFTYRPMTNQPYISYCMVVREDLIGTDIFNNFLSYYEKAIEKLNTTEEKIRLMKMDEAFWEMSMLEFLPISD
jgi:hypothetical protein